MKVGQPENWLVRLQWKDRFLLKLNRIDSWKISDYLTIKSWKTIKLLSSYHYGKWDL